MNISTNQKVSEEKTVLFFPGNFHWPFWFFIFHIFNDCFDSSISCIFKILSSWIVERSNLHGLFKFLISSILNFHVFIDFFGLLISRVFFWLFRIFVDISEFSIFNLYVLFGKSSVCQWGSWALVPVDVPFFQGLPSALPRFLARRMLFGEAAEAPIFKKSSKGQAVILVQYGCFQTYGYPKMDGWILC